MSVVPKDVIESHSNLLADHIDINSDLKQVKWLKYFDSKYKIGLFIVFETSFWEICQILVSGDQFLFVASQFEVISLNHALNSVKISKKISFVFKVIMFSELENKQVFEKKSINEDLYIILDTLETNRCINLKGL